MAQKTGNRSIMTRRFVSRAFQTMTLIAALLFFMTSDGCKRPVATPMTVSCIPVATIPLAGLQTSYSPALVEVSPDASRVIISVRVGSYTSQTDVLKTYDIAKQQWVGLEVPIPAVFDGQSHKPIIHSSDGKLELRPSPATRDRAFAYVVVDSANDAIVSSLDLSGGVLSNGYIRHWAFTPDNGFLYANQDTDILIWDAATGSRVARWSWQESGAVSALTGKRGITD